MEGYGEFDHVDVFGTFTLSEAAKLGVIPISNTIEGQESSDGGNEEVIIESFDKTG